MSNLDECKQNMFHRRRCKQGGLSFISDFSGLVSCCMRAYNPQNVMDANRKSWLNDFLHMWEFYLDQPMADMASSVAGRVGSRQWKGKRLELSVILYVWITGCRDTVKLFYSFTIYRSRLINFFDSLNQPRLIWHVWGITLTLNIFVRTCNHAFVGWDYEVVICVFVKHNYKYKTQDGMLRLTVKSQLWK